MRQIFYRWKSSLIKQFALGLGILAFTSIALPARAGDEHPGMASLLLGTPFTRDARDEGSLLIETPKGRRFVSFRNWYPQGEGKAVMITRSLPVDSGVVSDCHAQHGGLDVHYLKREGGKWSVGKSHYAVGEYGSWGEFTETKLVVLSPSAKAVVIESGFLGQGICAGWLGMVLLDPDKPREILSVSSGYDDSGADFKKVQTVYSRWFTQSHEIPSKRDTEGPKKTSAGIGGFEDFVIEQTLETNGRKTRKSKMVFRWNGFTYARVSGENLVDGIGRKTATPTDPE